MQDQGFDQGRITYVPNGVPEMHRIDRTVPTGCWTLGMAALFRPRKGVEVLIEALAAIRSRAATFGCVRWARLKHPTTSEK